MTTLELETYAIVRETWPQEGQVILASFDDTTIVVYQAFNAVTADYAVEHQRLGGPRYSLDRMSWIKPNFMWMMYRCSWLEADDEQARVLAIRIDRGFFDGLLAQAVPSSFRAFEDVSDLVRAQRVHRGDPTSLLVPRERVYAVQ